MSRVRLTERARRSSRGRKAASDIGWYESSASGMVVLWASVNAGRGPVDIKYVEDAIEQAKKTVQRLEKAEGHSGAKYQASVDAQGGKVIVTALAGTWLNALTMSAESKLKNGRP